MVIALLIALATQFTSGLFISDDVLYDGPLYDMVSESTAETMKSIHYQTFDILLILISIHILFALVHLFKKDNLIWGIVSGNKKLEQAPNLFFKPSIIGIVIWLAIFTSLYLMWAE